ncbi:MAG: 2-amino-4-hydroxy-6-hydroxymethyldihydropteridine diphosphokinase [Gammaproteobacteria bacterium]|nr:2-amino-4-hydroxy-6-hydroxymethyldihydropteridine diphosphokinase [Gammaproteobacteria bacterium]
MKYAFLSIGANQQDPIRTIHLANHKIQAIAGTCIIHASEIFQTLPFGVTQQPLFYNQVMHICTHIDPFQLLRACQHIELQLGRVRHLPWGPRAIDIDILAYENFTIRHPRLVLPHPQIWERSFINKALKHHYPKHFLKI